MVFPVVPDPDAALLVTRVPGDLFRMVDGADAALGDGGCEHRLDILARERGGLSFRLLRAQVCGGCAFDEVVAFDYLARSFHKERQFCLSSDFAPLLAHSLVEKGLRSRRRHRVFHRHHQHCPKSGYIETFPAEFVDGRFGARRRRERQQQQDQNEDSLHIAVSFADIVDNCNIRLQSGERAGNCL